MRQYLRLAKSAAKKASPSRNPLHPLTRCNCAAHVFVTYLTNRGIAAALNTAYLADAVINPTTGVFLSCNSAPADIKYLYLRTSMEQYE
jgi:hypothetical protein